MTAIKQVLSLGQSDLLCMAGLNPGLASLAPATGDGTPLFTIGDLLAVLPRSHTEFGSLVIIGGLDQWQVYYENAPANEVYTSCSLIDALYNLTAILLCQDKISQ